MRCWSVVGDGDGETADAAGAVTTVDKTTTATTRLTTDTSVLPDRFSVQHDGCGYSVGILVSPGEEPMLKRLGVATAATGLVLAGVQFTPAQAGGLWDNCTNYNQRYPHGVGKRHSHVLKEVMLDVRQDAYSFSEEAHIASEREDNGGWWRNCDLD